VLRSSLLSWSLLAVSAVLFLSSCNVSGRPDRPQIGPQDPLWSSYITHHSSGLISRRDKIRIVFANDVVAEEMVGQSASEVVTLEPSIEGSVTWASAHEVLIVPAADLEQESSYRVTVRRGDLLGLPEELDRYEFLVEVIRQEFEIGISGLSPDPDADSAMVLRGTLVTADIEDADRIERVVSASYMDRTLDVEWQHDPDGRNHDFSVNGIDRQGENRDLLLAWNGDVIGVDDRDSQTIEIPALNVFAVTRVNAVQDDRQYVVVYFSDSLDTRQNLSGLVSMGDEEFSSSVRGNTLRLMPQQMIAGRVTVVIEPGVRSSRGGRLENRAEEVVTFASNKPQVRFVGQGVVLPENDLLTIPFEAVNVHSVQVTAFRIFDDNVGQFLQMNQLEGSSMLQTVGRNLWRRTIPLSALKVNQWNRFSLDATDLIRQHPNGMFRLTLSINRGNSTYTCTEDEDAVPVRPEAPLTNNEDLYLQETLAWDYAEDYYNVGWDNSTWRDRNDPCKDAYYRWGDGQGASRNFLSSNIGIVVKRDQRGTALVATTNLKTAEPMPGVAVTFKNFQHQTLGTVTTDGSGLGQVTFDPTPFYAIAEKGTDKGYLKVNAASALTTSHFDVGGEQVRGGLKGYIYGERGVWRPGDDIFLTFVLENEGTQVPGNHPVTMSLFNPNGQLIQNTVNGTPTDGFYTFPMETADDAPTGNWTVRADVGGSSFSKTLKIETVIPNRLRVELDLGDAEILRSDVPVRGSIFGQWLSGAIAGNLRTDVQVRMTPVRTSFDRFTDYVFDDPARDFESEPEVLYEGTLDAAGNETFSANIRPSGDPPGKLTAHFSTRVFERGGAFSTNRRSASFSPYTQYVGIRVPPGDRRRGMLLTDSAHVVQIATVSPEGDPVSVNGIELTLYKINWRWWWDRSGETLAQYASSRTRAVVARGDVNTVDGMGNWQFRVNYPAWGRYLLRACDPVGRHCTGKVIYIDWPGWAGRAQEDGGDGAAVLSFFADKEEYTVGEIAQVQLPDATQGRALVTVENGTSILDQRWVEFEPGRTRFEVPITSEMSPNAYVSVSLIQPHQGRDNDRPIRLYGVIPLTVSDPETRLTPVIATADEWRPETDVSVDVSEANGRRMTYTLAVVDEGLLGLTSFTTPNLHAHFYQKEALGVVTWDLFDKVVGAYGGDLERLLALGGSGEAEEDLVEEDRNRFPPVVRFLGPFTLQSRGTNTHEIDIPEYVGAVRVMVVAGSEGAYGSASKSVFVREPLSMLATMPRVIGPGEELTVPVSLFAMDASVRQATLSVETDSLFEVVGSPSTTVQFDGPGEQLAFLRLRVSDQLGMGNVRFTATSPQHQTGSEINIEIRSPNPATVRQYRQEIAPGETWNANVTPHGLSGTNEVSLELTTLPPLNLERRLRYLIRYPHGCVEQVTSAVFPQLYLPGLVQLDPDARQVLERNIGAGIERLRGYQIQTGAFVYWPGGLWGTGEFDGRNSWVTNYVGHFLVEADQSGHYVPPEMLTSWVNFQKMTAQSWSSESDASAMDQAYRLYTLALAERPEMGAMNRLRESRDLNSLARWQLAAAYALAGVSDVANEIARDASRDVIDYETPGWSLGSRLRDMAIILNSMVALDMRTDAQALALEISDELYMDKWHSTHGVAFSLLAMSEFYGAGNVSGGFAFGQRFGDGTFETVNTQSPLYTADLEGFPEAGQTVALNNASDRPLYGAIIVRGVPEAGQETAEQLGLGIRVRYTTAEGRPLSVNNLPQGTDFVATVTVTNETRRHQENLALTHIVPSGWEIHNPRMEGGAQSTLAEIDFQDIRDDRVYTYFALEPGESKTMRVLLNASYLGRYYLPGIATYAMYDESKRARTTGRWVSVVSRN